MTGREAGPVRRSALLALALTCLIISTAQPSGAHSQVLWTQPADGSSISEPPAQVLMRFADDVDASQSEVIVMAPDGTEHQLGAPSAGVNQVVAVPVDPQGPPGAWRIRYLIRSWDRHSLRGEIGFTVTSARSPLDGSRPVGLPYVVAGGVLLAILGGIGLARTRRGSA